MGAAAIIAALMLVAYVIVERDRLAGFLQPAYSRFRRFLTSLRRRRASDREPQDARSQDHVRDDAEFDSISAEWVDGMVQDWIRAKWQLDVYAKTQGPIALDSLRFRYWPVGARALQRERGPGSWQPRPIGEGREREAGTIEFPLAWIPQEHRRGRDDATGLVEIYAEVDYTDESTGRTGTVTAGPRLIENVPCLSPEARALLRAAASDPSGTILRIPGGLGGSTTDFQTNAQTFATEGDPRAEAKRESAFEQLEQFNLVRDQGNNREVFKVTDAGYALADALESSEEP